MPGAFPASRLIESDNLTSVAVLVLGKKCQVTAIRAINTTAAAAYIQLFDVAAAASVSLGSTVPDWVVKSPASDPSDGDGLPTGGWAFENGIVAASTTTATGSTSALQHLKITIM